MNASLKNDKVPTQIDCFVLRAFIVHERSEDEAALIRVFSSSSHSPRLRFLRRLMDSFIARANDDDNDLADVVRLVEPIWAW